MLIYLLFQERQERKNLSNDLKESHSAHVSDLKDMLKIERPVNTDD